MGALFDNLSAIEREKQRRNARMAEDPEGFAYSFVNATPGWDAFFGKLHDYEDAGYNVRARFNPSDDGPDWMDPRMRGYLPGDNQVLNEIGNSQRVRAQIDDERQRQMLDQRQRQLIADQEQSYNQQVSDSLNAPPIDQRPIAQTTQPNGTEKYSQAAEPLTREAILNRVPLPLRAQYEAQFAKADQQADSLALQKQREERLAAGTGSGPNQDDVKLAVEAMKAGKVPPQLPGRASKDYTAIMAEANRQGYDLATAATDWAATQKHIATMNGAQQLRLTQAVNALPEMLDKVDTLASQWKGGKFPMLNSANLTLAKNGAFGKDAASIANQLSAQIADVTADLGNVYMGGNSPTDHALSLAAKSLSEKWDENVLHDMVKLAKENVQIRHNSIQNTGVAGASAQNPYAKPAAPPAPAADAKARAAELIKKYGGG